MSHGLPPEEFEAIRIKLEAKYDEKVQARRIKSIRVNSSYRWQPPLTIVVGQFCSHLTIDGPPEKIVAIYESKSFLVCTAEHGYEQGSPHIFYRGDVKEVTDDD